MIGRASTCHIMLTHPSVSKEHSVIELDEKSNVYIKDMNTLNGTFINSRRIVKGSLE